MQKQYRLCRNRQFSYVYRRGMRASCKDLTLIYARNARKRVGFSVSKKVGGAVVRNLIKRRLRECVRPLLPELKNGFLCRHCPSVLYTALVSATEALDGHDVSEVVPVQQGNQSRP